MVADVICEWPLSILGNNPTERKFYNTIMFSVPVHFVHAALGKCTGKKLVGTASR